MDANAKSAWIARVNPVGTTISARATIPMARSVSTVRKLALTPTTAARAPMRNASPPTVDGKTWPISAAAPFQPKASLVFTFAPVSHRTIQRQRIAASNAWRQSSRNATIAQTGSIDPSSCSACFPQSWVNKKYNITAVTPALRTNQRGFNPVDSCFCLMAKMKRSFLLPQLSSSISAVGTTRACREPDAGDPHVV